MPNTIIPTVLVVEDMTVDAMILKTILQDSYNIIVAHNGLEALEMLKQAKVLPQMVLLDVFMPKMNGYELLKIMKDDTVLRHIPVIVITSAMSELEGLAAGAVDFISKPYQPEIVKLRVQTQLQLKLYSDSLEASVADKVTELTTVLDNTLEAMAGIIEYRSLEARNHVKRTQILSKALIDHIITNSLSYSDELRGAEPSIIVKAVVLHDVGKIGIPDHILLKPGKLDSEEYEIMKTHTTIGKDIIESILSNTDAVYLKHCRDICYCHHERFDGKGYPRGIAGTEIPLSARILSIVDVYDALLSERVYKSAASYRDAMQTIFDGRGTQFDPLLVDSAIEIHDVFENISREYQ